MKNKIVRFNEAEVTLYEYTKTINFSAWVKSKLQLDFGKEIEFKKRHTKEKVKFFKGKNVVFTDRDLDILNFSQEMDFSRYVKKHLQDEINSKLALNLTIQKTCIICKGSNLRTKASCSTECQTEHKRQLQVRAEAARSIRDKDKRREYFKRYNKKKPINNLTSNDHNMTHH